MRVIELNFDSVEKKGAAYYLIYFFLDIFQCSGNESDYQIE